MSALFSKENTKSVRVLVAFFMFSLMLAINQDGWSKVHLFSLGLILLRS